MYTQLYNQSLFFFSHSKPRTFGIIVTISYSEERKCVLYFVCSHDESLNPSKISFQYPNLYDLSLYDYIKHHALVE